MTTFQRNISPKCTNFEVSSLAIEFQVSSLGVFDEVSVSVSKVTVSTTSLEMSVRYFIKSWYKNNLSGLFCLLDKK